MVSVSSAEVDGVVVGTVVVELVVVVDAVVDVDVVVDVEVVVDIDVVVTPPGLKVVAEIPTALKFAVNPFPNSFSFAINRMVRNLVTEINVRLTSGTPEPKIIDGE